MDSFAQSNMNMSQMTSEQQNAQQVAQKMCVVDEQTELKLHEVPEHDMALIPTAAPSGTFDSALASTNIISPHGLHTNEFNSHSMDIMSMGPVDCNGVTYSSMIPHQYSNTLYANVCAYNNENTYNADTYMANDNEVTRNVEFMNAEVEQRIINEINNVTMQNVQQPSKFDKKLNWVAREPKCNQFKPTSIQYSRESCTANMVINKIQELVNNDNYQVEMLKERPEKGWFTCSIFANGNIDEKIVMKIRLWGSNNGNLNGVADQLTCEIELRQGCHMTFGNIFREIRGFLMPELQLNSCRMEEIVMPELEFVPFELPLNF